VSSNSAPPADRHPLLRQALWLAAATVAWNLVEGGIAIAAGVSADSVALLGFGLDSFVETASGVVVGWRVLLELRGLDPERTERGERIAGRWTGGLLLALAAVVLVEAVRKLLGTGAEAKPSVPGLILTTLSLAVMPLLGWTKLRTAKELGSRALRADAFETITCAWLSLTTLGGLTLNAAFGWGWADPLAALVLVPLIVREGLEGWRGEGCSCHG
jgi:divalent metal cation (Fe/Co/Zn/Cd) transporter